MRLLGTFIAASAMCASTMCASLVLLPAGQSAVAPGGSLSVDIWVVGGPDERIAGVSLLLQDPRRTGWFSLASNLDRTGSPLCEPVAPPGYHPWPQQLGGPDGTNGYEEDGAWRGVDLGGVHPDAPDGWAVGMFALGRVELLVDAHALPGGYLVGADSILSGWCDAGLSERAFDCVTPLSFVIVPEPEETALIMASICAVLVVAKLISLRTR